MCSTAAQPLRRRAIEDMTVYNLSPATQRSRSRRWYMAQFVPNGN